MPTTKNYGADEARLREDATRKSDLAFSAAMHAAGYKCSVVTEPGTTNPIFMRGEPTMLTRGTSPASQCAELGSGGARGQNLKHNEVY